MSAQPRLVVSAPSSGHGKTAIAVGLLAACAARGIPSAGFKVGPDHTDAAYLGLAAGRPGRNLDPRLVGAQRIAPLFAHGAAGAKISVIEGAMGLFDSLTGQPEIDGTAAVAATLRAPVVLVVDVAAMGHSLAAMVHGFRMFDEMVHLGGVILNRVASPRHEEMLRTALDDIGMPVLGALRRGDLPNVLPARAHGPVPVAHRTVEASRAVRRLGESVAASLDMDRIMALAEGAPSLAGPIWTPADALGVEPFDHRPVVALAGGAGAPYTYVEAAELLTAAGADVAVVDPLRDEALPAGTRALIVGAGLPEGYAEELSANRRLCNAVAQFARDGWPIIAEGVALPWLGHDFDGRPMCGVLDATAVTGEQTVAGYREATAPTTSALAPAGARITGYKQHRALVTPRAGAVPAWTWSGGNPEGFVWRQVHASQLGLHWAAAPEIAKRVVAAAIAGPSFVSTVSDFDDVGITTQPMPPVPAGHPSVGQAGGVPVGHASHGPGVSGHGPIVVAGQSVGQPAGQPGGPLPSGSGLSGSGLSGSGLSGSGLSGSVPGTAISGQGQPGPSAQGGPTVMPAQPVSPGQGVSQGRPGVAGQRATPESTSHAGTPRSGADFADQRFDTRGPAPDQYQSDPYQSDPYHSDPYQSDPYHSDTLGSGGFRVGSHPDGPASSYPGAGGLSYDGEQSDEPARSQFAGRPTGAARVPEQPDGDSFGFPAAPRFENPDPQGSFAPRPPEPGQFSARPGEPDRFGRVDQPGHGDPRLLGQAYQSETRFMGTSDTPGPRYQDALGIRGDAEPVYRGYPDDGRRAEQAEYYGAPTYSGPGRFGGPETNRPAENADFAGRPGTLNTSDNRGLMSGLVSGGGPGSPVAGNSMGGNPAGGNSMSGPGVVAAQPGMPPQNGGPASSGFSNTGRPTLGRPTGPDPADTAHITTP